MITLYTIGGRSPFPIIEDFRTDPRTAWKPEREVIGPMTELETARFLRDGTTPTQTAEAIRSSGPQTMEAK